MVSFSCEGCGDVLTKKKLDSHRNQCYGASFTCLDCQTNFGYDTSYRAHTSCITEAQKFKYDRETNQKKRKSGMPGAFPDQHTQAMVPRNPYVEEVPEGADDSQAVAVVDVPPRAPTPPPAPEALPENVNVFDFLVSEETPKGSRKQVEAPNGARMIEEQRHFANGDGRYAQYSNGDGSQYSQYGFSYGHTPVQPGFQRYDSWNNMTDSQASQGALMPPPPPYVTPGPGSRREHKERSHKGEKSEKKRKRGHVEDLDLSSSSKRPASRGDDSMTDAPATHGSGGRVLHSGLTGGLSKLVTDPEFYDDRIDAGPTPISPLKRTKREKEKDRDSTKDDRRKSSYTSYSTATTTKSSKHPEYREDKHARRRSRSKDRSERDRESLTITKPSKPSTRHARSPSSSPEPHHRRSSRAHGSSIRHRDDHHHHHHRPGSVQPSSSNQLVRPTSSTSGSAAAGNNKAALFLSFITKGPESERGCSVNKALKRYHREQTSQQLRITGGGSGVGGNGGDEDVAVGELMDDKELWKSLRVRRNERGEVVLFVG
ncbi:hypothetical protein KC317_g3502 [Hortaea werneckii]|nr:hypothetical protein KC317_g3502 [Hortaea werneckii]KAI7625740.1 hypothetical protein KC346_g1597 [Hortaea werneckii]KAI7719633.1 hypothetical protein KC322_g1957 [Hortaea werneckii]